MTSDQARQVSGPLVVVLGAFSAVTAAIATGRLE
jgi:hypothetical protein